MELKTSPDHRPCYACGKQLCIEDCLWEDDQPFCTSTCLECYQDGLIYDDERDTGYNDLPDEDPPSEAYTLFDAILLGEL